MTVGPQDLAVALKAEAAARGFVAVGITTPEPTAHGDFLESWLDAGHHGEMGYLAREDAVARRKDLRRTMPGVRSVVVVAEAYPSGGDGGEDEPARAVIARYARGRDYHEVLVERLEGLAGWLDDRAGGVGEVLTRGPSASEEGPDRSLVHVDTGPVLERDLARRAGIGWFGRNTMMIRPGVGSYLLLGVILTPWELTPDSPFDADRCGSCSACLGACPTGALLGRDADGAPVMDARRCISYLTIENRGNIPVELRPLMGNRVFGCDICQEVCPWNDHFPEEVTSGVGTGSGAGDAPHGATPVARAASAYTARSWPGDREGEPPLPSLDGPDLVEFTERVLGMSGKGYLRVFAGSPLARPRRNGMLRNLCVALGNLGAESPEAAERVRPVLERAAADHAELVREHAEWGIRKLDRPRSEG